MTRTAPATHPGQHHTKARRPRIAVGTDGSHWGDAALDWALQHASPLGAEVHVFAAPSADDQAILRRLHTYRWLHTTITPSPDSPVRTMVTASLDNDLLVLGYRGQQHGQFGLGRWILPILTTAHCDTVIVRGEPRAVHRDHGWITAAIGGQHDDIVLHRAVQMATRWRSGLRLLHAAPIPAARRIATTRDPTETLEHAREAVQELAPDMTPRLHLVRSHPHEAMRNCARNDLLVIGPGSQPDRISIVTSTALHMAACPVLVVKPDR